MSGKILLIERGKGDLWRPLVACERAEELIGLFPGRTAVLLGRNVA